MTTLLQTMRNRDTDKSAAWKIFNWHFNCSVKVSDNFDSDYFNTVGFMTTGNPKWDNNLRTSMMARYLTINEMAELIREGNSFIIESPEQACIVYEVIKTHLTDWKEHLQLSSRTFTPPLEDFRVLDEMLDITWKIGRPYISAQEGPSKLLTFFGKLVNAKVIEDRNIEATHGNLAEAIIRASRNR